MDEKKAEKEFITSIPLCALSAVGALLDEAKIDYMIIGGMASAVWGAPRPTYDVDIIVALPKDEIAQLLQLAVKHGFSYQKKEIEILLKSDMIRMRYQIPEKEFFVSIDCILAEVEYQRLALQRKQRKRVNQHWIWFASPEDVVILKLLSFRGRDQSDIESILIQQEGKLDIAYVKKWVKEFGLEENFKVCLKSRKIGNHP